MTETSEEDGDDNFMKNKFDTQRSYLCYGRKNKVFWLMFARLGGKLEKIRVWTLIPIRCLRDYLFLVIFTTHHGSWILVFN